MTSAPRVVRAWAGVLATAALVAASGRARADDPTRADTPSSISGVLRPAEEPGDRARAVLAAISWPLRRGIDLLYEATENAAGLIQREQIVPRLRDLTRTRDGSFGVYPTFTVHRYTPVPGTRLVWRSGNTASSLFGQFGDTEDYSTEARVRFARPTPIPLALSMEAGHDRFLTWFEGLGQVPQTDPRNRFRNGPVRAYYREQRQRGLVSLGGRPSDDVEIFLSSSYTQRTIEDPDDPSDPTLRQAFESESIPGAYRRTRFVYTELALRYDSRSTRGGPTAGFLTEVYGGSARGVLQDSAHFYRTGGQIAGFIPILRSSNVLSPKIEIDGLIPAVGTSPLPFEELPVQPAFRGRGDRRDYSSIVVSFDYRWRILRPLAARVFTDIGKVAPRMSEMDLHDLRWCVGVSADLFGKSSDIGRFSFHYDREGVGILLSFGVPDRFGDRQHRDLWGIDCEQHELRSWWRLSPRGAVRTDLRASPSRPR